MHNTAGAAGLCYNQPQRNPYADSPVDVHDSGIIEHWRPRAAVEACSERGCEPGTAPAQRNRSNTPESALNAFAAFLNQADVRRCTNLILARGLETNWPNCRKS